MILLFRKAAALHALVLVVGQNELQTGLSPWGKVNGLRPSNGLANLRKVIEMQRDQIGEDARLLMGTGASNWNASINRALRFKCPLFGITASDKGVRDVLAFSSDLNAPTTRLQLCKGRHLRVHSVANSCALRVHREIKCGTNVCNFG
ncbi:hypothetical protein HCN50_07200 [Bradyrhizobium sp. WSM 1744]|uniref:Uncharacterized protein n=1 Tax=Bradyrhizobium archetypum TaxID=2721160 RepID=A0A7Y4M141_9BRAD|nr:hypothetical protein [Bradyrhizobium archetypum]NOJ46036.1 hypothetical protein [Bradyrhizobium archetypum]